MRRDEYIYIGLDLHKFQHTSVILDCWNEKLGEMTFQNKPSIFPSLLDELIYAVDKYSGIPMGFFLTFKPVDSNALKQCLIHAIMPKTYLKDLYPLVENDWIAHGIPHTIVVDNHTVNDSYEFEEACYQVGVKEVQFCTIGAGHQKGTIERSFKTLNTKFIHNLKGTPFSNFIEKGVS